MNHVVAFGSSSGSNRGHMTTTTQTSSLPTSIEAISSTCTMTSTTAASSDSITSLLVSVPHTSGTTSQSGTAIDVNPQHPLQPPMLKSIMDELCRTCNEVKKVQEEQTRMNTTLVNMSTASFATETSPYKISYPWTHI